MKETAFMQKTGTNPKAPASIQTAAVYRLQFNRGFTFDAAIEILPYLKALGVDCVYASPYLQAQPGSMHGYNITDPNRINPEIGGEEAYARFCDALKEHGMSQILDVVPNHMGIGCHNPWWMDVLENGPSSLYAKFFDIDWEPVKTEVHGKVLIPILGDYYGAVLENQEIGLYYADGAFGIKYFEERFPVAPDTYPVILEDGIQDLEAGSSKESRDFLEYIDIVKSFRALPPRGATGAEQKILRAREKEVAKKRLAALTCISRPITEFIESRLARFNGIKGEPRSFDALDGLLNQQAFRLAFWRVASEEINYRRFFDINELAAIRMEDSEVFDKYHALIFKLIREGKVQGLRIDHPDGLYDPPEYFRRIQRAYSAGRQPEEAPTVSHTSEKSAGEAGAKGEIPLFVIAEKILERKESLPADWKIHGTVGYDFMKALDGVFVSGDNEKAMSAVYENFIGQSIDFNQLLYDKKKFFALIHMSSEINSLGHHLDLISEHNRRYRDFTRNNLTLAIREVIACFPVYRTYITPQTETASERDQKYITIAVEKAKQRTPWLNPAVYDFLRKILLLQWEQGIEKEDEALYRDFVLRFQQLTGPIMAKGLEDTAFYVYNRLLALNEVGADPTHFGLSPEEFHRQNIERNRSWPFSFLATSTHDTKRSEDLRMRLAVLSEFPSEWGDRIEKWALMNEKHKTGMEGLRQPNRNVEYLIYQTLLGVWPYEGVANGDLPAFTERLWTYFLKCLREAKLRTDWNSPNLEYEEAVKKFVYAILTPDNFVFLSDLAHFQKKIADAGFLNSISALILKMGSPGIADIYQGCELWNFSLVDPDNRRQVDYETRRKFLECLAERQPGPELVRELAASKADGRLKMYLLQKSLELRQQQPDLFLGADYAALRAEGAKQAHFVGFVRQAGDQAMLIAGGRFFGTGDGLGEEFWQDTGIVLPKSLGTVKFRNIFTGEEIVPVQDGENSILSAASVFKHLNAAICTVKQD